MTVAKFRQEPGLGEAPGPLDRALRYVEQFGNLAVFQPDKEAEFYYFSFRRVLRGEPVQRLVDMEQLSRVVLAGEIDFVERNTLAAAAMAKLEFAPGIINENAAHAFSRGAEEMRAVLPGLVWRAHQAQPRLMNQRGGLQCVPGGLTCHAMRRQLSQLFVNERQQFLSSLGVALVNAVENLCDVAYPRTLRQPFAIGKRQL